MTIPQFVLFVCIVANTALLGVIAFYMWQDSKKKTALVRLATQQTEAILGMLEISRRLNESTYQHARETKLEAEQAAQTVVNKVEKATVEVKEAVKEAVKETVKAIAPPNNGGGPPGGTG